MRFGKSDVKRKERHFHGKGEEETASRNSLLKGRQWCCKKNLVVRCSSELVKIQNTEKHEQRSKECVQKEKVRGFDFTIARSSKSNKEEHRNEQTFEENEKEEQVKSGKRED